MQQNQSIKQLIAGHFGHIGLCQLHTTYTAKTSCNCIYKDQFASYHNVAMSLYDIMKERWSLEVLTLQSALCTSMLVVGTPSRTMVVQNNRAPTHMTTLMRGLVSLMYLHEQRQLRWSSGPAAHSLLHCMATTLAGGDSVEYCIQVMCETVMNFQGMLIHSSNDTCSREQCTAHLKNSLLKIVFLWQSMFKHTLDTPHYMYTIHITLHHLTPYCTQARCFVQSVTKQANSTNCSQFQQP